LRRLKNAAEKDQASLMERAKDPSDPAFPEWLAEQQRKQTLYERQRRAWAKAVGRPYQPVAKRDPRPPPGALDNVDR
jgi:hypothetical protein